MPKADYENSPVNSPPTADNPQQTSSRSWLPAVVAVLLLLLVLATFLWPNDAGNGARGDVASAGSGDGAAVDGSGSGAGGDDDDGNRGSGTPELAGGATSIPATTSPAVVAPADPSVVETAVQPETLTSENAAIDDPPQNLPVPPRLGFQTDLSAPAPDLTELPEGPSSGGGSARSGLPSFFGQTGRGSRFVYLIDRSGSMDGGRFNAARFELIKSIRSLREHESFYVIFYSSGATPMPGDKLVSATPKNQQEQIDWIRSISVGGSTNPTEALEIALNEIKPDTIWLLSDGQFNVSVADTIRGLNPRARVQINTIAFHTQAGEAILKIIADENDGDYRFVAP
ncbi:MAG: VWA domain-containing protein [Planctomycetota bacterium]